MQVLVNGTSWKVTLNGMIYFWFMLCSSEVTSLLSMPSQSFHLLPTHGTLSLTPSLLFIRPQPRHKAQYIILGSCPYNCPSKLRFFPFIQGEKMGFWFLRVKIIYFFYLHVWKHCFVCPVTAPNASGPAISHLMLQAASCSLYPMVRDKSYSWHLPLEFERDNSHSISPPI